MSEATKSALESSNYDAGYDVELRGQIEVKVALIDLNSGRI